MDLEDGSHKTHIFGVFDGHGGAEVAQYASQHLAGFMRQLTEYKEGDIEKALIQAFVSFDKHLLDEEVVETLKILAGHDNDTDDEKTKRDEAAQLREEANMDIRDLVAKYEKEHPNSIPLHLKKGLNALSPMIRKKKDEAGPSSSGQSSSRSSSSAEVSSSKQEEIESQEGTPAKTNGQHSKEQEEKNGKNAENGSVEIKEENEADVGDVPVKEDELKAEAPQEAKKIDKGKKLVKKVIPPPSFEEPEEVEHSYEEFLKNGDSEEDDDESGPDFVPGKLNYDLDDDDDSEEMEDDDDDEEEDSDSDEDEEDSDEDEEDGMFATRTEGEFEEPGKDSGCTAVLAVFRGDDLFVANAGDSRCVVSQKGKAIDMSIDHKPEDEREQTRIEAAGGQVTPDGRVNGGLNLSRALGDHTYKNNDKLPLEEQMISPLPDVKKLHIDADSEFMVLACDGIWYVLFKIMLISI